MKTLLIDNYDSYTYNLFQLIAEVNGEEPVVILNDAPADAVPYISAFDNVVVSPGPGHPSKTRDFGISARVLAESPVPVLGVCLGHQGIAHGEGGRVAPAPEPRHGHLSAVRHDGRDLFQGLPQNFTAVRYHSLSVREPLPDSLEPTAWAEDGVLMGLRHRERPLWGVQFHPESVLTEYGHRMLVNFRNLTAERARRPRTKNTAVTPAAAAMPSPRVTVPRPRRADRPALRLHTRRIAEAIDAEAAFTRLYADSPRAFWLDSSRVERGLSRFSFFGDDSGPLAEFVRYDVEAGHCEIERAGRPTRKVRASVFDYLKRQLANRRVDATGLPFDFTGGYVGYFGYETKADCGSPNRHRATTPDACWLFADRLVAVDHEKGFTYAVCLAEDTPQAAGEATDWLETMLARLTSLPVEPDRRPRPTPPGTDGTPGTGTTRGAAAREVGGLGPGSAGAGLGTGGTEVRARLRAAGGGLVVGHGVGRGDGGAGGGLGVGDHGVGDVEPWLVRDRETYLADIAACRRELAEGTSYEICLTDAAVLPAPDDAYGFYRVLRRVNPAPYAAFLNSATSTWSAPRPNGSCGSPGTVSPRPSPSRGRRRAVPVRWRTPGSGTRWRRTPRPVPRT